MVALATGRCCSCCTALYHPALSGLILCAGEREAAAAERTNPKILQTGSTRTTWVDVAVPVAVCPRPRVSEMQARVARWSWRASNADAARARVAAQCRRSTAGPRSGAENAVDVSKERKRLRGVRPRAQPRNARLGQSECLLSVGVASACHVRRHMIDERTRFARMPGQSSKDTAFRHNWMAVPLHSNDD
jgi:hypothetical protein